MKHSLKFPCRTGKPRFSKRLSARAKRLVKTMNDRDVILTATVRKATTRLSDALPPAALRSLGRKYLKTCLKEC